MSMEYKNVSVAGVKELKDEEGIVEAIVSVTGIVDNVNDVIEPGAYQKTLATRKPKGVWHHSWTEPIAKTLAVEELMPGDNRLPKELPNGNPWPSEAGALLVKMQFNLNGERGKQAYSDVKFFGSEQEWSIGYNVPTGGARVDTKDGGKRRIRTLDLYEYSPVLFGAMPNARTTGAGVKAAQTGLKTLKEALGMEAKDIHSLIAEHQQLIGDEFAEENEEEKSTSVSNAEDEELDNLVAPDPDEDDEEDYEPEEPKTKSLDPAMLRKAITGLMDVLEAMEADSEEEEPEEETEGEKGAPIEFIEAKALEFSDVAHAVIGMGIEDRELQKAAERFDLALKGDDAETIREAAADVLDVLEDLAMEADEDGKSAVAVVGRVLGDVMGMPSAQPDSEVKSIGDIEFKMVVEGIGRAIGYPQGENLSVQQKRAAFLSVLTDNELTELADYVMSRRGNSGLKAAIDHEAIDRSLVTGETVTPPVAKKRIKPRPQQKRQVNTQEREKLAKRGDAMPDGSFPIADENDLKNAIRAVGRASDPDAAKAHIKKCAKKLGKTDLLPDDWQEKVVISMAEFKAAGLDVDSLLK
jgi:hypothetical protein